MKLESQGRKMEIAESREIILPKNIYIHKLLATDNGKAKSHQTRNEITRNPLIWF
jgi:hypothetical protein